MKLKIKKSYKYLVVVILCIALVGWKLDRNKKLNASETQMANVSVAYLPVKVDTVKISVLKSEIESSGIVKSNLDLVLLSETQGKITEIYKQKGDYVSKGELIAKVDDEVLKAQLELSKVNLEACQKDFHRLKKLVAENAVSKKDFEDIGLKYQKAKSDYVTTKKKLEDTQIKSPVTAYINDDYIDVGMFINGGVKICNIIDPSDLKMDIYLSEKELLQIGGSKDVNVSSDAFPGDNFKGEISNIAQKATDNNLFKTEISLNGQSEKLLKAGMFVQVRLDTPQRDVVLISRKSISGSLKSASVFIVENDYVIEKDVVIADNLGEYVVVESGISKDDIIVSSGTLNLYNRANIRVIN